ncbi:putative farnesyl cysteine-carboxyl methyltransferase [Operophtera brumata]|uniref:Putative farnesyl cysteine-carboxyl methyltransferase n=1 Tax=Operophtera brumata TaxID=104452 RepID=A0A0L7KVH8_OPEBR|nr:putative farnesyl cysteine-carboxyl methyltransferase [Operophtera brumata]
MFFSISCYIYDVFLLRDHARILFRAVCFDLLGPWALLLPFELHIYVSIRSAFLGAAFAIGMYLASFDDGVRVLGLYTMSLSMFHFSEFMSVALTNPRTLTVDSFILNHSLTLLNPFCIIVYALASWTFFRERVFAEELTLITFFGHQYLQYQKKVPTGLPFIQGHTTDTSQKARDHWSH